LRIKLDENLPVTLVDALRTLGHDVDTVAGEALTGANDKLVWQAAQQAGRWSIWVNGNWRITFEFRDGHAHVLDYEDHH
jgi:hypothetical protein